MWVADKRVELDGIRLDAVYVALKIQWCDQIPGISGLDLVYRFYCDNPPQVHSHTQLVHGKISMTQISGTTQRDTSKIYKIMSPSWLLHGHDLQWKLNGGK